MSATVENKISRLRAMVAEGQQTWDLSPRDVEAIQLAVDVLDWLEHVSDEHDGNIDTWNGDGPSENTVVSVAYGDYESMGKTALDCFVDLAERLRKMRSQTANAE